MNSDFLLTAMGAITAAATSISAWVSWRLLRGQFEIESKSEWTDGQWPVFLRIRIEPINRTATTYDLVTVRASGVPIERITAGWSEDDKKLQKNVAAMRFPCVPGDRDYTYVYIMFDWRALAETKLSMASRVFRRKSARLTIEITAIGRSPRHQRRKFRTSIPIPVAFVLGNVKEADRRLAHEIIRKGGLRPPT